MERKLNAQLILPTNNLIETIKICRQLYLCIHFENMKIVSRAKSILSQYTEQEGFLSDFMKVKITT